jgi:ribonuclease P protein component
MPGQAARLRSNQDYRDVLKRGRSVADSLAVLYVLQRPDGAGANRLGISVPRRFGTAVARNRVRRLFWEAYRLQPDVLPKGADLVLIPRVGARGKGYHEVTASLRRLLSRQGLFAAGGAQ